MSSINQNLKQNPPPNSPQLNPRPSLPVSATPQPGTRFDPTMQLSFKPENKPIGAMFPELVKSKRRATLETRMGMNRGD